MAMISSFLGAVIVIYSYDYIGKSDNHREYYFMVVLFIGAMMGITLTTNLIFLYLFWEISAVCCWRLIGFFREKEYVRRADKAFLITGAGAFVMLAGFLMIYNQYGTADLIQLAGRPVSDVAVALILFGILSKSATLPLHSWLADAGIAPTPATALLHAAVLVKIGLYAYARLFVVNFDIGAVWHTVIPVIAAASAIISAGAAFAENDIKRIIAYSTVSQIGFIFFGLSIGGETAFAGTLLYILMHAVSKAGLFLCAGIIEHSCHTKDIRNLGGLYKTMPKTAVSFFICAFSVIGVPPLGGFFSKYLVISGAIEAGQPIIAAVFIIGAVMTALYLLRVFVRVFLGEPRMNPAPAEGSPGMVFSVAFLAVLSVASGLAVYYPSAFVEMITHQIAGV
jgi:NADH:ubiquinone oxidoreductase subunit 5 (subunit L)/multisubunit Na+/H+ antiporter MnhA subunit